MSMLDVLVIMVSHLQTRIANKDMNMGNKLL